MILGLLPRDVIEAMLAGQAVMLHAVMTDSIHSTLRGEVDTMCRGTRANIVALNKAIDMNIDKLEQYHARPSEGTREAGGDASATARTRTPQPASPVSAAPVMEAGERSGRGKRRGESRGAGQRHRRDDKARCLSAEPAATATSTTARMSSADLWFERLSSKRSHFEPASRQRTGATSGSPSASSSCAFNSAPNSTV